MNFIKFAFLLYRLKYELSYLAKYTAQWTVPENTVTHLQVLQGKKNFLPL